MPDRREAPTNDQDYYWADWLSFSQNGGMVMNEYGDWWNDDKYPTPAPLCASRLQCDLLCLSYGCLKRKQ
jgi:hypothetical protein